MSHKVGASSCPDNLKLESFSHRNNNESLFKRDLGALFTDSGVRLTEIVEGLASLDSNGFFSNAMDNPFVVDHSRISRKNICFSVMREKIQSKNYETWRSFVDDFEDICHNAMNNHEKGSRIWDAANTLLYEGKKYLEQYADRALAFFGLSTKVEHRRTCGVEASNNGHCIKLDKVGHTVRQEGECSFLQSNKELIGTVSLGKCSNFPYQKCVNPLSRRDMTVLPPDERLQNVSGSTLVCTQNMVYVPEEDCRSNPEYTFDANEINEEANDSIVEILEGTRDDIRSNPSEQATECSSSFGDIQLDTDDDDAGCKMYDAAEVQSELRNGNGAAIPSEDKTSRKRKKALSDEWKDYRRGYEWRCQWLELQVKELLSQASKYDNIVANIQARKLQKNEQLAIDALTTRSSSQIAHTRRHRILQRKQRKKIESTVDFSEYMSHHPLFSLYDKKRLDTEAVSLDDDPNGMSGIVEVNDAGLDENDLENPLGDGDNSMEQTLVLIETLQSRIIKMKNQLNKCYFRKSGKFIPRNISTNLVTADSSKCVESTAPSLLDSTRIHAPVGEGSKLQAESNLSHQQNSDFDVSHSVMPCNRIPPSVELAQDDFIETSEWHLLDNDAVPEQPEKEDSSEEVTCKEAHKEHDANMEAKEKKNQDICCQDTKHFEGEGILGKRVFQQQQTTGATEKDVEPIGGESIANICLPFNLFVPKCKRRKTHSRSSSLQRAESLHVEERNSSSMQENEMNEVKMENGADLSGDGIGDHL